MTFESVEFPSNVTVASPLMELEDDFAPISNVEVMYAGFRVLFTGVNETNDTLNADNIQLCF